MKTTKGIIKSWDQIDQSKADTFMTAGHPERYDWMQIFKGPGLKENVLYIPQRKK